MLRFLAFMTFAAFAPSAFAADYGVTLAPGETVVETMLSTGPIVRVPERSALLAPVPAPLQPVRKAPRHQIDPVTGKPRNQAGWSGATRSAASIACFPRGACAHLNGQLID